MFHRSTRVLRRPITANQTKKKTKNKTKHFNNHNQKRCQCGERGLTVASMLRPAVSSACALVPLRWPCPRTPWWSVRWRWAGQSMAAAASSSSWAGWAYCPACTGSSRAAGELWSLGTRCVSSRSSPSWWRLRRATASGNSSAKVSACEVVAAPPKAAVLQLVSGGDAFRCRRFWWWSHTFWWCVSPLEVCYISL